MVPRALRFWSFARLTGFAPILWVKIIFSMRPDPKFKRAGDQFHDLSGGWREVADGLAVPAGIPDWKEGPGRGVRISIDSDHTHASATKSETDIGGANR
jgi:hypothetical protein